MLRLTGRRHAGARRRVKLAAGVAAVAAMLVASGFTPAPHAGPAGGVTAGGVTAGGVTAGGVTAGGVTAVSVASAPSDWATYDRTGARAGVSISTPAFTSSSKVVRAWTVHVDSAVYSQPLVVGRRVFVATENDSVYAFDAATGRRRWARHLAPPVTSGLPCGNISPSGITGTPVADVAANRLWVVTFSPNPFRHTLWSLDLTSGVVLSHRRVDGPGSDPRSQQERGALALTAGRVFVPYGGLDGDCSDYHGWVVGAPTSGRGALVSYVTPTRREAGVWSPAGPAVGHDSLYVATGNGTPTNAVDDSDSVVRLSPSKLEVLGRFTPSDYQSLSSSDRDLGTTSPVLLPDNLVVQIGKEGVAYVIGAYRLGHVGGQLAERQVCSGAFGGDAVDGLTVVMSCYDGLYAVRITPPTRTARPRIRVSWAATGIAPGPPIIAGGVVWDVTRANQLLGFRLGDGRRVYTGTTNDAVTSFPSLSASQDRLFVPQGAEVVSYRGI